MAGTLVPAIIPFIATPEPSMANNLRQHEQDETQNLRKILDDMNILHAKMGGRDSRPERVALMRCMEILDEEINRSTMEWINKGK
jgi:hypothetical protein